MRRFALCLALAGPAALACGVCVDDKVAATYDYAVVQRAVSAGKVVVFCELAGTVDPARLAKAARLVPAVEPGSLRVSPNPAAVSFVLDTRQVSPQAAAAAMHKALGPTTRLKLLRTLDSHGLADPSAPSRQPR